MKIVINLILVVLAFTWISGVFADKSSSNKSPESIVTCASLDTYVVASTAVSDSINTEACVIESPCNPCIESLESQGCKIIDLKIDHLLRDVGGDGDWPQTFASFLLSCKKP